MKKFIYIVINFVLFLPHFNCQTNIPQSVDTTARAFRNDTTTFKILKLTRKNRIKYIEEYTDLKIFYNGSGKNDSMTYLSRGVFRSFRKDSILLEAEEFEQYNRVDNSNFKSRSIWPAENIKICTKDITKVYRARDGLQATMFVAGVAALVSGLIVSPLVSIEKNGFNKTKFKTITGISLGTLPIWIGIGVGFGWHKCYIRSDKKKTWKIEGEPN